MPVFLVQNTLVARPNSLRVRLARPTANGLRLRCEARGEGAVLFGSDVARAFSVESFRQVGARRIEKREDSVVRFTRRPAVCVPLRCIGFPGEGGGCGFLPNNFPPLPRASADECCRRVLRQRGYPPEKWRFKWASVRCAAFFVEKAISSFKQLRFLGESIQILNRRSPLWFVRSGDIPCAG